MAWHGMARLAIATECTQKWAEIGNIKKNYTLKATKPIACILFGRSQIKKLKKELLSAFPNKEYFRDWTRLSINVLRSSVECSSSAPETGASLASQDLIKIPPPTTYFTCIIEW